MSISKSSSDIFIKQKEFFESKETLDVSFRIRYLKKLKQIIYQHEDDIINALSNDLGKSLAESYMSEIAIVYNEINYVLKNIRKWCKRKKISFLSSPFDNESLDLLFKLKSFNIKIASGEITHYALLKSAAKKAKK